MGRHRGIRNLPEAGGPTNAGGCRPCSALGAGPSRIKTGDHPIHHPGCSDERGGPAKIRHIQAYALRLWTGGWNRDLPRRKRGYRNHSFHSGNNAGYGRVSISASRPFPEGLLLEFSKKVSYDTDSAICRIPGFRRRRVERRPRLLFSRGPFRATIRRPTILAGQAHYI